MAKSDFTKCIHREEELNFLIPDTRQVFTQLRQVFIKAPILGYFNFKHHIRIETDAFGYTIYDVLSQITLETS